MKRQFRKDWWLGFAGFMTFQSLHYFQSNDWIDLFWFAWIAWFVYFIPIKKK